MPTKPKQVDRLADTWIKIGCYRETGRLTRVLEVYQKALALADASDYAKEFAWGIVSLHDHKGCLTVEWKTHEAAKAFHEFVDEAWGIENEDAIVHRTVGGEFVCGERKQA